MRWNPSPGPEVGETRIRQVFALFPTRMDDGSMVWLEKYTVEEKLSKYVGHYDDFGGFAGYVVDHDAQWYNYAQWSETKRYVE